jgi:hypothetical protein
MKIEIRIKWMHMTLLLLDDEVQLRKGDSTVKGGGLVWRFAGVKINNQITASSL